MFFSWYLVLKCFAWKVISISIALVLNFFNTNYRCYICYIIQWKFHILSKELVQILFEVTVCTKCSTRTVVKSVQYVVCQHFGSPCLVKFRSPENRISTIYIGAAWNASEITGRHKPHCGLQSHHLSLPCN